MAPDADKLHQRKRAAAEKKAGDLATQDRISTVKGLSGTEVAIEGVIYDISTFVHPGGSSIGLFGGNDATIPYKMIHPYHTSKHLEKMKRVGVIPDYQSDYKFDTPFEQEIKREVFKIVRRGQEFGTYGWHFRCMCYTAFFFSLQFLWVTKGSTVALAVIYGISQALVGLNIQHDANHGAASKTPWINDVLGLGADFIGGSKWLWMEQHWMHHSYTNHPEKDPDTFGAEPFIIFNDYALDHPARKAFHSFQAFFFFFVLAGYWISAVFNPQILSLKQAGAQSVGFRMENDYIKDRRKYAISLRLLYIYVHVVVPFQHHSPQTAIYHIAILAVVESMTLAVLFSLSHNFVDTNRDPTKEARASGEPVCWFKSEVEACCTYGGFISGALTGGLNFQVEHHLFPRMSSAHYPYIAPKVREICKKHNVRYVYYPWIHQNWWSTMKYLHAAGTGASWENNPLKGNL